MEQVKLSPRCWALKRWLESNHIDGHFWSIETICSEVKYPNGEPCYQLNTDPYNHDKCIALSNDVRTINWSVCEGYKIIIKDSRGAVKLCENESEFEAWRQKELKPLEKKWKFLNNLRWKADRDGSIPLINLFDRVIDYDKEEPKPVSVYASNYETDSKEDLK